MLSARTKPHEEEAPKEPEISDDEMFKGDDLSLDVQRHLVKVYQLLGGALFISVVGCATAIKHNLLSNYVWPYVLVMVALICAVHCIDRSAIMTRCLCVLAYGLFQGLLLGPLVQSVLEIDQRIVTSAFLLTSAVFIGFSLVALFSKRRMYLYLGAPLFSTLCFLVVSSLFPTVFGFSAYLYLGLVMFSLYVIADTQRMVARVEILGIEKVDFVSDALKLYMDFVAIFIRILIIIAKAKGKSKGGSSRGASKIVSLRSVKTEL